MWTRRLMLSFAGVCTYSPLLLNAMTYSYRNAPDAISAEVLAGRLSRLDQGPLASADPAAQIHTNFPQIIEQNFAGLSARDAALMVDSLSKAELSDLAQLYVNAVADSGARSRLLLVLANRLDVHRLWRLSEHFGFTPMLNAIASAAPTKLRKFKALPRVVHDGPIIGEGRFGPNGRFRHDGAVRQDESFGSRLTAANKVGRHLDGSRVLAQATVSGFYRVSSYTRYPRLQRVGFGQFLHYTPYEVYLSFRTAPGFTSLGVAGALWETSVVLSRTLLPAYFTGHAIGSYVVKPLVETYAPSLYADVGEAIATIVDKLSSSWSSTTPVQAAVQRDTASEWSLGAPQMDFLQSTGGDFGSAFEWHSVFGSGGGGCWWSLCDDTSPNRTPGHAVS